MGENCCLGKTLVWKLWLDAETICFDVSGWNKKALAWYIFAESICASLNSCWRSFSASSRLNSRNLSSRLRFHLRFLVGVYSAHQKNFSNFERFHWGLTHLSVSTWIFCEEQQLFSFLSRWCSVFICLSFIFRIFGWIFTFGIWRALTFIVAFITLIHKWGVCCTWR